MDVFVPADKLLKKYIDCIYIIKRDDKPLKYTAYPSTHLAVGLFSNANIVQEEKKLIVANADFENAIAIACNRLHDVVVMDYKQVPNEVAINFKPMGFNTFTNADIAGRPDFTIFNSWDDDLTEVLNSVFSTEKTACQTEIIQNFLLSRYSPLAEEEILTKAIAMLCDFTKDYCLEQIAALVGVHYKHLYRCFKKYVGCSPARFKKIDRFRNTICSRLKAKDAVKLTETGYDNNYADQSHFIRHFRQVAGENPTSLFKDLVLLGGDKIAWKFS
ncbi:MAG: helix-turn-helix domain-containing protein [Flavipsychrobacter sp.]|nr:helix-turn-helix domain-containing protein [Flavipsychrobacter sp.]